MEHSNKKAASPAGKSQKAIMEYLGMTDGEVELTGMTRSPAFKGIHFQDVMSAAEALDKKGLIEYKPSKGSTTLKKKGSEQQEADEHEAVSPPGWENTVKNLKKHPGEVDNPWALCLSGETKIPCLDGIERTVREISDSNEDVWLYAIDASGLVVPGHARAKFTGLKRVVEITLDNDQVIRCSPEHRWVMRDGSFVPAVSIQSGSSLMPFRIKDSISKKRQRLGETVHEMVYHPGLAVYSTTHWAVSRVTDPYGCLTGEHQIHHKNHNPRDNRPCNLQRLTRSDHCIEHPERVELMRAGFARKHADPLFAKVHATKAQNSTKAYWASLTPEEKEARVKPLRAQARSAGIAAGLRHKEKAAESSLGGNHKVVKISHLDEFQPMFDVAVDGWHTFAVSAGVFSHNSWWMKDKGYHPHKSAADEFERALVVDKVAARFSATIKKDLDSRK